MITENLKQWKISSRVGFRQASEELENLLSLH